MTAPLLSLHHKETLLLSSSAFCLCSDQHLICSIWLKAENHQLLSVFMSDFVNWAGCPVLYCSPSHSQLPVLFQLFSLPQHKTLYVNLSLHSLLSTHTHRMLPYAATSCFIIIPEFPTSAFTLTWISNMHDTAPQWSQILYCPMCYLSHWVLLS